MNKGLIIVFTGNGKGKTTSALGIALRACGHDMKTLMIQFIKGSSRSSGEIKSAKRLSPLFEIQRCGRGFVGIKRNSLPVEKHIEAARKALKLATGKMESGMYDIIILDEINNALSLNLIKVEEVLELIKKKPPQVHLILTGRDVHPSIVDKADLVTEMREIKHPFVRGLPAEKGIDF